MNFIFVSPNFPDIYSHFVKALKERGVTVLGIGDTPYSNLNNELKENLTEYCYVSNLGNLEWMKNTVSYLKNKYGPIDYLESNNEFWLENDAQLREFGDVINVDVIFTDIDSTENGLYKNDTIPVVFHHSDLTGGDGHWYEGSASQTLDITLQPME